MEEGGKRGNDDTGSRTGRWNFDTWDYDIEKTDIEGKARKHRMKYSCPYDFDPYDFDTWNFDTGYCISGRNRETAIGSSKFISELHKLRIGGFFVDLYKLIDEFQYSRQMERGEWEKPTNMKLVTKISFGMPIIQSFSEMLSEYYKEKYGIDFEVLDVQSNDCKGEPVSLDGAQCAKWFHVNFTAKVKDDDDDGDSDSEKVYFAELVVFSFRFTLLCNVVASLPVEPNDSGNSWTCMLKNPDPEICHPSLEAIRPAKSPQSKILAYIMLHQLSGNKSMRYPISSIKDSRDIPFPKTIMLFKGTVLDQRWGLAQVMSKYIENYGKPRLARNLEAKNLEALRILEALPACHRRKYGVDLEAVYDLNFQHSGYYEGRLEARWFHMNFYAKKKLDDGGDSSKLYFAEVVQITLSYPLRNPTIKYVMTVCVAVDPDDPAGNFSKCEMCSNGNFQICHPSAELYDSKCEKNPYKFKFWRQAEEFLKKMFPSTNYSYSTRGGRDPFAAYRGCCHSGKICITPQICNR